MRLCNLEIVDGNKAADIHILNGKITAVGMFISTPADEQEILFKDAIVFPGLINSHDHLDFNLFPQLGNKVYDNYVAWGKDIHTQNKDIIKGVSQIPKDLRVQWGIYKNMINGVTTVVDHGHPLQTDNEIITVLQQYHFLHSVQLEKNWRLKLNKPFRKKLPYVIHIGEGTDSGSHEEINKLNAWNIFGRELIGVHGIAMNERQAASFKALVWCPDSNFFLTGATAPIDKLKHKTDILFGTDSTLTASWNLWEQLRTARSKNMMTDEELYSSITVSAARIWEMNGCGKIQASADADIVIAKRGGGRTSFDAFYAVNPEDILLVMHKGSIRLFDAALLAQVDNSAFELDKYSKVVIDGSVKYIYGDLPALMKEIKSYCKEVNFPFESMDL